MLGEERERPLGEQLRRALVVAREARVGEVVLVAGVEEELRVLGCLDQLASRVDVALADEDRVLVHPVDLRRNAVRPRSAEVRERDARVVEERPARSSAGLSELLRRDDAEGEPRVDELGGELVRGSLGVLPAQWLAQTRPGAKGALFFYSCVPVAEFGTWPAGVPAQIHGMDADPIFMEEGDVDAARELVDSADDVELFLYPGDQHYFADSSLPSYDAGATRLLTDRVLAFLARIG